MSMRMIEALLRVALIQAMTDEQYEQLQTMEQKPKGEWRYELTPLTFGRWRIIDTDGWGVRNFW